MKLEVGRTYAVREGTEQVKIMHSVTKPGERTLYYGDDCCLYSDSGAFWPSGLPGSRWDLVRDVTPAEPMTDVLAEVFGERVNQDAKWGQQDHSPSRWLSILGEEHGEVCRAVCEALANPGENAAHWANYREELIQLAAVAVSMVECFDRNNEETK